MLPPIQAAAACVRRRSGSAGSPVSRAP